jgi:hypothetical protein
MKKGIKYCPSMGTILKMLNSHHHFYVQIFKLQSLAGAGVRKRLEEYFWEMMNNGITSKNRSKKINQSGFPKLKLWPNPNGYIKGSHLHRVNPFMDS